MNKLKKIVASVLTSCFVLSMIPNTTVGAQTTEINNNYIDWIEVGEQSEGVTAVFKADFQNDKEKLSDQLIQNDEEKLSAQLYIPNELIFALTPTSTGYVVTFYNYGIDAISSVSFTLKITDINGNYVNSKSATLTNLKVGETTYTWTVAKSATVQETITISGSGNDGGETYILSGSTVRYNFAGGKYGTMEALGGQKHHMPSSNALTSTGVLSTYSGPCIRMITADHYRTASYGSSSTAVAFRNQEISLINSGKFIAAQNLGVSDIQNIFDSKYDVAINQMRVYTLGLGLN